MPIYIYKNPKTEEIIEVIQTMLESHIFIKDGIEYQRVFVNPEVNTTPTQKIDPFNKSTFLIKLEILKVAQ